MQPQSLLPRSRSLIRTVKGLHLSSTRFARSYAKERTPRQNTGTRLVSSSSSPGEPSSLQEPPKNPSQDPPPPEKPERPSRRKTNSSTAAPAPPIESVDLPPGLDILWTPTELPDGESMNAACLPPPEILEEALNNLHITLHPQTQNRAVYASPQGPPTEPTLALYCPIEGGDYVVDATVKELARRTGSEVVVLDAVQLAAGEWGDFGKAANFLQLPKNPLHFRASMASSSRPTMAEEEDDDDAGPFSSGQMTVTLMSPSSARGSAVVSSSKTIPPNKTKMFFDALVNIPSDQPTSTPRIIYVRDFPTLAPTSSTWYRPLLTAVRQRRRGPISSPSSPICNPMTIIFGITPPITPPEVLVPPSSPSPNILSLLMNRNPSASLVTSAPKPGRTDWSEDEVADKAREARLRRRLKKWEKGDASILEELPTLVNEDNNDSDSKRPEVIVLGGNMSIPLPGLQPLSNRSNSDSADTRSPFFRTSILVPSVRSIPDERDCRIARRREINELTIRMAIGAIGGALDAEGAESHLLRETEKNEDEDNKVDAEKSDLESMIDHEQMWDDWGKRVELWMTVRHIADRAVGSVVADRSAAAQSERPSLEPTSVSWDAVARAWSGHRLSRNLRKSWMKDALPVTRTKNDQDEDEDEPDQEEKPESIDEVVDRLKNDPDLDGHEQRLLPCIVNTAAMPTTFSQVHLPTNTIDSVRTIVSLPLLHPEAFQQGILKEHTITGCLLFGPPGTGKTLVVRALAKEAGCRMMAISPSDVMDMYVGEGEKLVRAVFSLARKLSPCVVFLDEIDALLGARSSGRDSGSSIAYRGVITEFMQEMDGLKTLKDSNVIVIGATNRPFDLDDAVLRRLPRRLLVDLPGEKEREEILKILLRHETLDPDVDIKDLAKRTESFSGSDLKHLCVSAAVDAVKEHVELPWLVSAKADQPVDNSGAPVDVKLAETTTSKVKRRKKSDPQETSALAFEESGSEPAETNNPESEESKLESAETIPAGEETIIRTLSYRHFAKALKEITPSSSEATGTLAALRKWNEEFGEGRRDRKRRQIWGKGRFGFTDPANFVEEDGRVLPTNALSKSSGSTGSD
ncbi:uncharacterized protein EV420DRAFT_278671 [Desarmillaria tabescens]|uniref:AAA+ ATPase domain-containing protein n=1 Tax=Armillaria tabescens TaxID=1929756 RepID=A0AA39KEF0_ARMTA|nr:uncharacterized protein EV420DRAFT_278671 [Desarmillaria tabescens]KAK0459644.1 hypothetical protein EV420DRAFT_278671 [Desarmillaria tabescens]